MQRNRLLILLFILLSLPLNAQGFICAVGGGSENYNDWSDAPYRWIVQKSYNGKIIILSVNDETTWIPNYFLSFGASSAVNKKINTRAIADSQSTYNEIVSASGVFIKGGDQWNYVNLWKGTKTEAAIREVFRRGGVVAGTSAGAMVLGGIDFTAQYASPTSFEAIQDFSSSTLSMDSAFLPLIPRVIFDTHTAERGRQGRMPAFMWKTKNTFGVSPIGVSVDDRTAICIDSLGIGTVMGSGAVAVFYEDQTVGGINAISQSINKLRCNQITNNWKCNLRNGQVVYRPPSARIKNRTEGFIVGSGLQSFYSSRDTNRIKNIFWDNVNLTVLTHPGAAVKYSNLIRVYKPDAVFNVVTISQETINNAGFRDIMLNTNRFLVFADSLSPLLLLNDATTLLGAAFAQAKRNREFYFFDDAARLFNGVFAENTDTDPLAAYRGKMTLRAGWDFGKTSAVVPVATENTDYFENRFCSVFYTLANTPQTALFVSGGTEALVSYGSSFFSTRGYKKLFVISSVESKYIDSSVWRASSSVGPRQVYAIDSLLYTILNINGTLFLSTPDLGWVIVEIAVRDKKPVAVPVISVFPNPVRTGENIKVKSSAQTDLRIELYNTSGELIQTGSVQIGTGESEIPLVTSMLASGVYILVLKDSAGGIHRNKFVLYR